MGPRPVRSPLCNVEERRRCARWVQLRKTGVPAATVGQPPIAEMLTGSRHSRSVPSAEIDARSSTGFWMQRALQSNQTAITHGYGPTDQVGVATFAEVRAVAWKFPSVLGGVSASQDERDRVCERPPARAAPLRLSHFVSSIAVRTMRTRTESVLCRMPIIIC